MSVSGIFRAAPELEAIWSGLKSSTEDEENSGVIVSCPETIFSGKCCTTCAAAAEEAYGTMGEDRISVCHTEERVLCPDGASLQYQVWEAHYFPPQKRLGFVLVLHDYSSDSVRSCRNVVPQLLAAGFSVAAYDLRGHGRSSDLAGGDGASSSLRRLFTLSRRIVVDGDDCWLQMQRFRNDVETITRRVGGDAGEERTPVFLLGDGFGGALAIEFVVSLDPQTLEELGIRGIAASGAMLGFTGNASFEDVYRDLDAVGCSKVRPEDVLPFPKHFEDLSRDLRVGEMVRKDALRKERVNALILKAAVRVIDKAAASAGECPVPLAFFHGTEDSYAPISAVEDIVQKAQNPNITLTAYPHAKHWLHHEVLPARAEYLRDLAIWLRSIAAST